MEMRPLGFYLQTLLLLSFLFLLRRVSPTAAAFQSPSASALNTQTNNLKPSWLQQDEAARGIPGVFVTVPLAAEGQQPGAAENAVPQMIATGLPRKPELEAPRADLGVQEPLSFYGSVNLLDQTPTPKVPVWMWVSATVVCVLLLVLWLVHQRRMSAAASTLRVLQGRCFRPPASVYMAFVFAFFPLSGVVAWLSLVEPRGSLLLSQLRSAWEVGCIHCFMLLMLHLLGGPDTALLLVRQQHRLPSIAAIQQMLKGKEIVLWPGDPEAEETDNQNSSVQRQLKQQGKGQFVNTPTVSAAAAAAAARPYLYPSCVSSNCSTNGFGCGSSRPPHTPERIGPATSLRRGASAPDLLLCGTAHQGQAAAAAAAATSAAAAGGDGAMLAEKVGGTPEAQVSPPESPRAAEDDLALNAAAAAAAAAAAMVKASETEESPRAPDSQAYTCASPSAAARQRASKWKRHRKVKSSKSKKDFCARPSKGLEAWISRERNAAEEKGCCCCGSSSSSSSSGRSSRAATTKLSRYPSLWRRCREKLHIHRMKQGAPRRGDGGLSAINRGPYVAAATAPQTSSPEADKSPFEGDPLLLSPAAAAAEGRRDLTLQQQQQQRQQKLFRRSSTAAGRSSSKETIREAASAAAAAAAADNIGKDSVALLSSVLLLDTSKQQQQQQQQQQQRQRQQHMFIVCNMDGGRVPAVTCSTCSSPLTPRGSVLSFVSNERHQERDSGCFALTIQEAAKAQRQPLQQQQEEQQQQQAAAAVADLDVETDEYKRRIWFVPPLCCLARHTRPRHFTAWDMRMSYRCLLPFTILKLLRVLVCYLLPSLVSISEKRGDSADAGDTPAAAVAAAPGADVAGFQHLLQRLLQLCCFLSFVFAMWGLAVVFVATRPLLKPFRLGWKFTCLKALVLFIQILEIAAELLQPVFSNSGGGGAAAAEAAAATTTVAHRVYLFTFFELVFSAVCTVLAVWAFRPEELIIAYRQLLLLQQYLASPGAAAKSVSRGTSMLGDKKKHAAAAAKWRCLERVRKQQ